MSGSKESPESESGGGSSVTSSAGVTPDKALSLSPDSGLRTPDSLSIGRAAVEEMFAHARACRPAECCGLLGGRGAAVENVYPLRNVADAATVAYEAAPEDLFAAQRQMRARGEGLLGIYHSHPRSADPAPSATDVRLAFYPSAVYFIIGFDDDAPVLRAFRISESEGRWEQMEIKEVGSRQ
jgi:proteasome lid subunit RPN8/RPN11